MTDREWGKERRRGGKTDGRTWRLNPEPLAPWGVGAVRSRQGTEKRQSSGDEWKAHRDESSDECKLWEDDSE